MTLLASACRVSARFASATLAIAISTASTNAPPPRPPGAASETRARISRRRARPRFAVTNLRPTGLPAASRHPTVTAMRPPWPTNGMFGSAGCPAQ